MSGIPLLIVIAVIVLYIFNCIKILREYERGVIFRLGRVLLPPKGPGLIIVFRPIDQIVRISLRQEVLEVPPQDVITRHRKGQRRHYIAGARPGKGRH
jgi:regulator of protease activity HflC (stomatin/prohibitin superfamily)